jgi:hypothetical protein
MDALVKMPGKGLASSAPKGDGLVAMNQALECFAPALAISNRYSLQWGASICTIGVGDVPGRSVDVARKIHRGFLAALAEMDRARETLRQVTRGDPPVEHMTALAMLRVLFVAIGKRKSDEESALLLAAAADMFHPVNDVLGFFTGEDAINRHPLVLAIAVKRLIATEKWTSCAELREAMAKEAKFISRDVWHLEYMAAAIGRADDMLFEKDRATWDETHVRVDAAIERLMLSELEDLESPYVDDDDVSQPGSPRWQALDEMLKAKQQPEPTRLAASRQRGHVKRSGKAKASSEQEPVS